MRDALTTLLEIVGGGAVVAGVAVLFGLGAALLVGGVLCIALGYLLGRG